MGTLLWQSSVGAHSCTTVPNHTTPECGAATAQRTAGSGTGAMC